MSRIIVKNLPNQVTGKKLKEIFSAHGSVTDVQLKHTPDGKFRGFGFIGFQSEEQAIAAQNALNKSFINTSQITVEICAALDDPTKPRPWSKHAPIEKPKKEKKIIEKKPKGLKIKDAQVAEMLETHQGDVLFEEFMEAHLPNKKEIWQKNETEAKEEDAKEADKLISDLEYLKLKTKSEKTKTEKTITEPDPDRLTVKLSNLPCTVKKSDVKEFIKPAKPVSIRIPVKTKGIAYCDFEQISELNKAVLKNRSFLGTRRITVKSLNKEKLVEKRDRESKVKKEEERLKQAETVADSGRLFIRNLSYNIMESDLRPIFEKFGPITELNLPIDPISRKPKGFGFITYLIPEHAVKALNELDGTVFHGRMLHIIPGIAKTEEDDDDNTGLTFKEKKLKKEKQMAGNKINWNTFFINENCLAEAMADVYNTTKSDVLSDGKSSGGAAVRLALGETEMVQKTKSFLEDNGVLLEAFENMSDAVRSDTVILVKNLPFKTEASEIREKFAPFGELKTVLLSPYGGTGIIEFIEPSEARKAFRRLAYTKFKHIPLYLEWGPQTIFDGRNKPKIEVKIEKQKPHIPVEGATLYVKGINFGTNSEALKKHFEECGQIISAIVAEKRDPKNPTQKLSMGYGFVEFADTESADKALKTLQFSSLDNHTIDIKRSNRTTNETDTTRKRTKSKPSTKILVRNLPFQATQKEVNDLFKVFGEIKALRLPKKMVGTGSHRGFCFVEYISIHDAKRAFQALSESTHLYGRRLVLEWAESDDDVETLRQKTAKHFNTFTEKRKRITIEDLPADEDEI